jgi:hypothetical protein
MDNVCFGLKNGNKCGVLTEERCVSNCKFFKTHDEHFISVRLANKRLRKLNKTTQAYIAEKYHKNTYPWEVVK